MPRSEASDFSVPRLLGDAPVLHLYRSHPGGIAFRGVSLDRLPKILSAGIDTEPTDSIIYCDFISKAHEYGGDAKAIMAFRYCGDDEQHVVRRAVTQILPTTDARDTAELRRLYPFEIDQPTPNTVTLCRVQPASPAEYNYLQTYGYFIPNDRWDALVGLLIYGDTDALTSARSVVDTFTRASV